MLQPEYADRTASRFIASIAKWPLEDQIVSKDRGIRYRHVETINSLGSAHLEHASRSHDHEVTAGFCKLGYRSSNPVLFGDPDPPSLVSPKVDFQTNWPRLHSQATELGREQRSRIDLARRADQVDR